jgi:hypothetical protein
MSSASFGGRAPRAENGARQEMGAPRALPPFRRLDVSGTAEVLLVQGSAETVSLSTASRKAGFLRAEVLDDTLHVESGDASRWWDFVLGDAGQVPQVVVTYKDLEAIAAAGTVKLVASGMKVDALRVAGAGGTVIRLDDLTARELKVTGAGALRADVSGSVEDQTVTISGAGDYRAGKLVSQNATVNVAGAGKVTVNARKTLAATISGAGSVEYFGDPQVTERVSGAGRVKRRDAAGPFGPVASASVHRAVLSARLEQERLAGGRVAVGMHAGLAPHVRHAALGEQRFEHRHDVLDAVERP